MKNKRAMIDNMGIGHQMRAAMVKEQVSVAQLAYRLGETSDYVNGLKRGGSCTPRAARRMAHAFGMGVDGFLELK